MKYTVIFTPDAEENIQDSYEWGVSFWGRPAANKWVRQVYAEVFASLRNFPKRCSIAPESEDTSREIRQFIVGRYRILFEIKSQKVIVLNVLGPFRLD